MTEEEYNAFAGEGIVAPHFDHEYVQQLGLALIDDNTRWQRGGEYLRMAARGLPALGPTIFVQIAQAHQRAGHADDARHNYELAKRAGLAVGQKDLADAERQAYFATVKLLGEDALARDDLDAAIENYHLYAESERSGLETLRTLATLHEKKGDALSAMRVTDQALVAYNAKDKDLLERKDRYYYSVMPEQVRARLESVRLWFDFDYCLRKARSILDGRYTDLEWLDVAHHMVQLALVVKPESLTVKILLAKVLLRYGEREKALTVLEDMRHPKPEKFASGGGRGRLVSMLSTVERPVHGAEPGRSGRAVFDRFPPVFQERGADAVQDGASLRATRRPRPRGQVLQAGDGLRGQSAGAGCV